MLPVGIRCGGKRGEGRWSWGSGSRHDVGPRIMWKIWIGFGFKVCPVFMNGSVGVRIRIWVGCDWIWISNRLPLMVRFCFVVWCFHLERLDIMLGEEERG